MRNQGKCSIAELTPSATVSITEFNKIDGSLLLVWPPFVYDLTTIAVNPDQGSGCYERRHRAIIQSHQSDDIVTRIEIRQQTGGNFSPDGDHAIHKLCCLPPKSRLHLDRQRHCGFKVVQVCRERMSSLLLQVFP